MKKKFLSLLTIILSGSILAMPIYAEEASNDLIHSTMIFGQYEQDNIPFDKEDIEWEIIKESGSKKLLVSKYSLDYQIFAESNDGLTWENSHLNNWLNTEFLEEAFSPEEAAAILVNQNIRTNVGNTPEISSCKIFILSSYELENMFSSYSCKPTDYAKENGATDTYWARDIIKDGHLYPVFCSGDNKFTSDYCSKLYAVRPALWIDTDKLSESPVSEEPSNTTDSAASLSPEEILEEMARLQTILDENGIEH